MTKEIDLSKTEIVTGPRTRFLNCWVPSFNQADAARSLDALIDRELLLELNARVAELEGYIEAHNAKVLNEPSPSEQRIELLEAALKAIRHNLARARTSCFANSEQLLSDAEDLACLALGGAK